MELEFVSWLRDHLPAHRHLHVGPGDDAAVLDWARQHDLIVTADLVADGVHFRLAEAGARRVGRKAIAVNLSDLAAMAAKPQAAVVSLLLPRQGAAELAVQLYEGMLPLAEQFDLAIAGGDTNCWDGPLVIAVTAMGQTTSRAPLLRSGARGGDLVIVSGAFGGSILGHHYDFHPRVEEAIRLNAEYKIHAAIDVSDGLTLDLWRLCQESHCGAVIQPECVPISDQAQRLAAQLNPRDPQAPLLHALEDGEDFELILAVPPSEAQRLLEDQPLTIPVTQIGWFTSEPGLWKEEGGSRSPLVPGGFRHGG